MLRSERRVAPRTKSLVPGLLLLLLASPTAAAQAPDPAARVDSIARAAARVEFAWQENVAETTRRRLADSIYHAQLEAALQRSAVDGTWMGVFVGAVGVLIAIGAIAAGGLLYRQGREYQLRLDKTLSDAGATVASYRAILDGFLAEKRAEIDVTIADLHNRVKDADAEQRQAIEEKLEQVERYQATLLPPRPNRGVPPIVADRAQRALTKLFKTQDEFLATGLKVVRVDVAADGVAVLNVAYKENIASLLFFIPDSAFEALFRGELVTVLDEIVRPTTAAAVAQHLSRHPESNG